MPEYSINYTMRAQIYRNTINSRYIAVRYNTILYKAK